MKGTNPLSNQRKRRVEKTSLTMGLRITPHVRDKKPTQSYSILIQGKHHAACYRLQATGHRPQATCGFKLGEPILPHDSTNDTSGGEEPEGRGDQYRA